MRRGALRIDEKSPVLKNGKLERWKERNQVDEREIGLQKKMTQPAG